MTMHERPPERRVISAVEISRLLGRRDPNFFYSVRPKLEAAGFPRKLPGIAAWSRAAVERWIDGNGEPDAVEPSPPASRPTPMERRFAS